MNTYKKSLYTYYIKQTFVSIGFSILYTLTYISGNSGNSTKIDEYYKKVFMSMAKPIKTGTDAFVRRQVHVI